MCETDRIGKMKRSFLLSFPGELASCPWVPGAGGSRVVWRSSLAVGRWSCHIVQEFQPGSRTWLWGICAWSRSISTFRLWENGCYIADNIFKLIFLYKSCLILILTTSILYWPNYSHPCYPQVHRDEVLLKFQDEFQQKYTGDPYNVSFQFNR